MGNFWVTQIIFQIADKTITRQNYPYQIKVLTKEKKFLSIIFLK